MSGKEVWGFWGLGLGVLGLGCGFWAICGFWGWAVFRFQGVGCCMLVLMGLFVLDGQGSCGFRDLRLSAATGYTILGLGFRVMLLGLGPQGAFCQ